MPRRLVDVLTEEEKQLRKEVWNLSMEKQRLEGEIQALQAAKARILSERSEVQARTHNYFASSEGITWHPYVFKDF